MLGEPRFNGNLLPVSILLLFIFPASCGMKEAPPPESPPQETSPAAEAGPEGAPEIETGTPEATEAEAALTAALTEAEKDGRLIFLHTGADW